VNTDGADFAYTANNTCITNFAYAANNAGIAYLADATGTDAINDANFTFINSTSIIRVPSELTKHFIKDLHFFCIDLSWLSAGCFELIFQLSDAHIEFIEFFFHN